MSKIKIEYDQVKNAINLAKHGVSFERVSELDFDSAIVTQDIRNDYGEIRFIGYAMLNLRLYCLVWTPRNGYMRPISFRKANKREIKDYEIQKSS